jgi:hypothetical protein
MRDGRSNAARAQPVTQPVTMTPDTRAMEMCLVLPVAPSHESHAEDGQRALAAARLTRRLIAACLAAGYRERYDRPGAAG